jgi:hypothetical protein
MNQSIGDTSPEVLGNWIMLPDDHWLQRNYAHLANSMFPGGNELPTRLAQLAIYSLETRRQNLLREDEKQCMLEYILRSLPTVGAPATSELGGPERAAALVNDVGVLEAQITGKSSLLLDGPEALKLFLQIHGAVGMEVDEGESSQETEDLVSHKIYHVHKYLNAHPTQLYSDTLGLGCSFWPEM